MNLEALLSASALLADWKVLLGVVAGVGVGMVVAITPGLTGVMAVALALPFTFFLDSTTSIGILLGIYVTSLYGGSVTAIMIATPGTPNAAATLLDGYPMARQGRAREALEMALYASLTGGLISTVIALAIFPIVATFALSFGPPQMFALIVFSITIIAGVSGASLVKGFIAAVLGFLVAMIGQDVIHGSSRMTFGSSELLAGLHILPVMIGLFTVPEIIIRCVESRGVRLQAFKGDLGPGLMLNQYLRLWPTYLRSSCIGSLVGALPGIGGSPAAFLSYFMAQRVDPHPERFGTGAIEGVAAAESGNNSVCGPALVPMMSLGIPGDTTTAIIMGALIIHGLAPGPMLFASQPEFVYVVFLLLFVCLIVLLPAGLLAIRFAGLVAKVRPQILFPVVLVLAAFGAYAIRNSPADVVSMFAIGALGFFMRIQAIPAAPFAIAFILGPLLEENFRRSMLMSGGSSAIFFESALSVTFLVLAVASAIATVFAHRRIAGFTKLTSG
ncbi:MAG TPA: tripartite tricarboxylate transporter permease [Rhodospirillales bacterium]